MFAHCKMQYIFACIDIPKRNHDRHPKTQGQDGDIDHPNRPKN